MAVLRNCKQHGKQCWFCTAHKKQARGGAPCQSHIPEHAKVCHLHGGNSPMAKKGERWRETEAQIAELVEALGLPVPTTPTEALTEALAVAFGDFRVYRNLVAELALHPDEDGKAAIYGLTGNERVIHEAAPNVLVRMFNDSHDRLTKIAKDAAMVDLEERTFRLAEMTAHAMVDIFERALGDSEWGLSKKQREGGRNVLGRHLELVADQTETA